MRGNTHERAHTPAHVTTRACALALALALALIATTSACPKDDVARPLDRAAPPTHGVAAARVLHVDGTVDVTPAQGAKFAAKVGTDLVADDTIGASSSSKVVVVLRNGHAVRIDDAGALRVRDIVLFQAPPTQRPVDEQLKELMDENESLPLDDVRDRAAAWRQMLRAAETAGAESRDDAARESAKAESPAAVAESAPSAVAAAAPPPQEAPKPEAKAVDEEAPAGGGSGGGQGIGLGSAGALGGKARERDDAEKDAAPLSEDNDAEGRDASRAKSEEGKMGKRNAPKSPSAYAIEEKKKAIEQIAKEASQQNALSNVVADSPAVVPPGFTAAFGASVAEAQAIAVPASLAAMSSSLGACIAKSVPPTVSMSTAQLLIEVRDGKAKRVRLSGALPVPLCARGVAVESIASEVASTRGNNGWLVVTVPLSR